MTRPFVRRLSAALLLCLGGCAGAQHEAGVPDGFEPRLARSSWPMYHADPRATASSPDRGPGAVRAFQAVDALTGRRLRRPAVSPWVLMAEPYPDGSQAAITTPNDGVAKYLLDGDRFEAVHFLDLDRRDRDFDWGIVLLADGLGVVTERKHNRFVVFGDARPGGPRAPLEVKFRIPVDERRHGRLTAHHSLAPSGHLIALTSADKLIAVDLRRQAVVASVDLPTGGGFSYHNSFPIDARGRIFLSTQARMIAVDWDGRAFGVAWEAAYDMRGPGCEGVPPARSQMQERLAVSRGERCTGTGTTPTILSSGVVVIVDGHAPQNNLVAFWQDAPPPGWAPLRDGRGGRLDPQVAGVLALPHSTPEGDGFTAENSPAALGDGVVVAQWAGFRPGRDAPRGVQRVDWDPARRALVLRWANPGVHYNGIPTIACERPGACQTYGMGWHGAEYAYTSLDFETGRVTGRIGMGRDRAVLDLGNGHAVAHDGSVVYSGRYQMVRVR